MIELENTYLMKKIPEGLFDCGHKEVVDVYLPITSNHPVMRLRKNGDDFELTKKYPVKEGDASQQAEETIILDQGEFDMLNTLEGKRVHKVRYYYDHKGHLAEVDVFKGDLEGLIVVDFEFDTVEDKDAFMMPDFCLVDVTQETFVAGGMLAGKEYGDIEGDLDRLGYIRIAK